MLAARIAREDQTRFLPSVIAEPAQSGLVADTVPPHDGHPHPSRKREDERAVDTVAVEVSDDAGRCDQELVRADRGSYGCRKGRVDHGRAIIASKAASISGSTLRRLGSQSRHATMRRAPSENEIERR